MSTQYKWRVVQLENGWYKVQQSENDFKGYWYDRLNLSPLCLFLYGNEAQYYHMFLWLAKRKVDRLVKKQERRLAAEAYVPKVVYGPYP